jgi:hypothetical protein
MEYEHKFRAWDKYRMVYFSNFSIGLTKGKEVKPYVYFTEDTFEGEVRMGSHTVMQCTGVKDVKGNEIYEGDIFEDSGFVGVVKFGPYDSHDVQGGHVGFFIHWNNGYWRKDLMYWANELTVAGNIHQNKNLTVNHPLSQ